MMIKFFKNGFFALLLTLSLAACGDTPQGDNGSAGDPAAGSGPNVGNLAAPAPGDPSVDSQEAAQNQGAIFFQRKELWDTFSAELKTQVQTNYGKSGSMLGEGPGGHGYYNSLFGRTSPNFSSGSGSALPLTLQLQPTPKPPTMQLRTLEITSGSVCNAASTFLCLDRPAEGEGTVIDSILVKGGINLTEAALFNPEDPIVLISVFRQSGEAVNEYGLKSSDLSIQTPENEGDPQTASFNKTVGLAGPGTYTIVVSAFKNVGDSVILESIGVTVVRQDVPEIELVSLLPPPQGNLYPTDPEERDDPVASGDTVSMASVKTTVRLKSPGTTNVGIIFENFDQSGNLRYITNGDTGFGTEEQEDGSVLPTKSADLPLVEGLNKIKITAHNSILDQLGFSPDEPSTVEFNLTNVVPKVSVKMISPEEAKVIEATGAANQKVDVAFCLTDLTALPGRTSPASPGECILNWNGEKPTVTFNGHTLAASDVSKDGSGVYKAQVKPQLGGNLVEVAVTNTHFLPPVDEESPALNLGQGRASFSFGETRKVFDDGDYGESNTFTKRGLSLEINKKILTDDVKKMLVKFLNRPDFKDTFKSAFGSAAPTAPNVCWEYGAPVNASGDTTVEFLDEGFELGSFEVTDFTPRNDNLMAVTVILNGFKAEANLRGLNAPTVTYGGHDVGFIPLDIDIAKLTIKVGIRFPKRDGISYLDVLHLHAQNGVPEVIEIEGGNGLGGYIHIDSTRNPSASGLELMENERGTVAKQFYDTVSRTILCGIENGLNAPEHFNIDNPPATGMGYWIADLKNLVGYNNLNPFRIPLEFDLLNKLVGIDIAYDALRGDITFNDRGLQIQNVPLRISSSPRTLGRYKDLLSGSIGSADQSPEDKQFLNSPNRRNFGPLAAPVAADETPAVNSATGEVRNLGLTLPEDGVNQALFAANLAGILDLDIDPNFWTNNGITFIDKATPTVQDMLGAHVDINQNGIEDDDRLPVQLRIRTDKTMAPVLHFLSQSEIHELAERVNCFLNKGEGDKADAPCDPSKFTNRLNPDLRYFRISIPNVEISIYRVYPLGSDVGGVKNYCAKADPIAEPESLYNTRPNLPPLKLTGNPSVDNANKACRQTVSPLDETHEATCPEGYNRLVIPVKNGPVLSAVPVAAGEPEVPVVRYKGDLVLHGVIQGVFREVLFADQYKNSGAAPTNFLRLKFVPTDFGPEMLYLKMKVVENHTGLSESALTNQLSNVVIPGALGTNCETLNELQISVPDRFPSEDAQSEGGLVETLHEFGVDHFDFGDSANEIPQVFVDDNHLYLDVLAHLGVCYEGESCTAPQTNLNTDILHRLSPEDLRAITVNRKIIDWTKH